MLQVRKRTGNGSGLSWDNPLITKEILCYCEDHGIYQIHAIKGNSIIYYSYFGREGFYKVTHNIRTNKETRQHLRYTKTPSFLLTKEGYTLYNYFSG